MGSRLAGPPRSFAMVWAGSSMTTSAIAGAGPAGCAVITIVRAPASRATLNKAITVENVPGPALAINKSPGPTGGVVMSPDHVRIQAQVHQPHAKSLHHQTLAADSVAGDAAGTQDFVAHPVGRIGRQTVENRTDLRESPMGHGLHAMTGLSAPRARASSPDSPAGSEFQTKRRLPLPVIEL